MNLRLLLFLVITFFFNNLFSQKINRKTYATENGGVLVLLPKKQFGYEEYSSREGGGHIALRVCSTGKYTVKKNKILLKHKEPKHFIDSLVVKKSTSDSESINIKMTFKSYIDNTLNGIDISIKSKDSSIDLNTEFEDSVSFFLNKDLLPLTLMINGSYKVKITEQKDHTYVFFVNDFKKNYLSFFKEELNFRMRHVSPIKSENKKNRIFNLKDIRKTINTSEEECYPNNR